MSLSTATIAGIAIASGVVLLGGSAYLFGKGGKKNSDDSPDVVVNFKTNTKTFRIPKPEFDTYAGGKSSRKKHSKKNHSKKKK